MRIKMDKQGNVNVVPPKKRAGVTVRMGADTIEALGWALDQAYADQESYLNNGDTIMDYGIEWPEHARQCAGYCRNIAAFGEAAGLFGEMERWNRLAEQFDEGAGICRKCGATDADNGEGWDGLCGNCADKAEDL